MTIPIILIVVYIIGMPICLRIVAQIQKKLVVDRAEERSNKKTPNKKMPQPIWWSWKECISFAIKNKRPATLGKKNIGIKTNLFMLLLWTIGLIITIIAAFTNLYILLPISYLFFIFTIVFAVKTSKPLLEERKRIIQKMFDIGTSKGLLSSDYSTNPNEIIKILEWKKDEAENDTNNPQKVQFNIKTEFSDSGEAGFLQQFNQIFGSETTWVPSDDPETGAPGWDYQNGILTIYAVPPLPTSAPFHERYVLSPGVAWSFVPIALGVEGGLELPNPETGEIEHVLGFDFSENEPKAAKEAGLKLSDKITTSPMVLCAGATGGGKSLSCDTIVYVK